MKRYLLPLLFVCSFLWSDGAGSLLNGEEPPDLTNAYVAKVVGVHDGDTITVDIDLGFDFTLNRQKIRLFSVYAPELGKPGGAEATAKLKELLYGNGVLVIIRPVFTANAVPNHEIKTLDRWVARVWRKDLDVCEEMNVFLGGKKGGSGSGSK